MDKLLYWRKWIFTTLETLKERLYQNFLISFFAFCSTIAILFSMAYIIEPDSVGLDIYGIIMAFINYLFPLWIFYSVVDYIILRLSAKNTKYLKFPHRVKIYFICILLLLTVIIGYDLYDKYSLKEIMEQGVTYFLQYVILFIFTIWGLIYKKIFQIYKRNDSD